MYQKWIKDFLKHFLRKNNYSQDMAKVLMNRYVLTFFFTSNEKKSIIKTPKKFIDCQVKDIQNKQ